MMSAIVHDSKAAIMEIAASDFIIGLGQNATNTIRNERKNRISSTSDRKRESYDSEGRKLDWRENKSASGLHLFERPQELRTSQIKMWDPQEMPIHYFDDVDGVPRDMRVGIS